ncbi:MAG: FGGY-family carbohydrate kinase, partial [Anaerolineales bacterium]|nr:FGGY-family carbohydrate kinase [Anaerolineales bacterium]
PQRIADFSIETNQPVPPDPGSIVRCILESLALKYKEVLNQLSTLTARKIDVLHIVGGGSQNHLLNQLTANATGLSVIAGPVEATVIGNALVQLITLGEIEGHSQARQIVAEMDDLQVFTPEAASEWEAAYQRFQGIQVEH